MVPGWILIIFLHHNGITYMHQSNYASQEKCNLKKIELIEIYNKTKVEKDILEIACVKEAFSI